MYNIQFIPTSHVYCAVYQNKKKASSMACKVAFHVAPGGMNTDIAEYDMYL
jgi:hypothetical protein